MNTKSANRESKGASLVPVGARSWLRRGASVALLLGMGFSLEGVSLAQSPGASLLPPQQSDWQQPSSAPEQPDSAGPQAGTTCAIGQAGAACSSIVLFELGMRGGGQGSVGTLDVGLLVNQGKHQAWGGTFGLQGDGRIGGWTAKARYRRWLDKYVGVDVGVGAGKLGSEMQSDLVGIAEVALEFGDIIAFTAAANTYPGSDFGRNGLAMTYGVRLGSYPTLALLEMFR